MSFQFSRIWYKWKWYKVPLLSDTTKPYSTNTLALGKSYPRINMFREITEKEVKSYLLAGLSENGRVYFERGKDIDIKSMWLSDASDFTLYMLLRG